MSHSAERKEKVCLNCNARVFGPYCQVCGQQNVEPKETAWGLVVHFFNDITHFEGKFITSLRYLFFRPGFLTAEYIRGRRASYMNPVRMYVFASAFFFILFFTFFKKENIEVVKINEKKDTVKTAPIIPNITKEEALEKAESKRDSAAIELLYKSGLVQSAFAIDSTIQRKRKGMLGFSDKDYKTIAEYESAQSKLLKKEQDNWLERIIKKRLILIDQKYDGDLQKFNKALFEYAMHSMPKVLFISLPLFAFALFVLYLRHKKFYYVSHVIFTIHFYVFLFLGLLLYFSIDKLQTKISWDLSFVSVILWIYMYLYLYKAMRRVYEQRRAKTILKFFIMLFGLLFLFSILFIGLFSYSFFNI
jgi:hypothetical protein